MSINLKEGEYFGDQIKSVNNNVFNLCVTQHESNSQIINHYHDNNYISILLNGQYNEFNDKNNHQIKAGDILFRPKNYDHENKFENLGGTCFNIEFKSEWVHQFDTSLILPDEFFHFKTGKFTSLYKLFIYFSNGNNEDLLLELLNDWLFEINQKELAKGYLPWIEKIINILNNEIYCFHSLQSLSDRVFVEKTYMARAFKERQGITIGEFQLKSKIENAFFKLLNSSKSINEIAFENGFFDDAHFIKAFKLVYKISPLQFRYLFQKSI